MKKLFVISNESIFTNNEGYFCDNIDLKSTPESLNKNFEINLIARKSSVKKSHKIEIKKINVFSSLISFLFAIFHSAKEKNAKYLLISISPYTFLACLILKIFKKKTNVYLRSNGFDEYKIILGQLGFYIYYFMFYVISKVATMISCRKYILNGKKGFVITPSQLNNEWIKDQKKINNNIKKKLLYVGRIRKEKGIFSLLEIIKNKKEIHLTITGEEEGSNNINYENVEIKKIVNNRKELINLYDSHNIFILPSYTEGEPMVLLESLSRLRPVIIFQEIEHVIQNRAGIFISERNYESLIQNINHIVKNYENIQELMKKNILPQHDDFIKNLSRIIVNNKD